MQILQELKHEGLVSIRKEGKGFAFKLTDKGKGPDGKGVPKAKFWFWDMARALRGGIPGIENLPF